MPDTNLTTLRPSLPTSVRLTTPTIETELTPFAVNENLLEHPTLPFDPDIRGLNSLKEGCYFLQFTPLLSSWSHFNGTLRIERHDDGVTASGDLYYHPNFKFKGLRFAKNPDPSPRCGIPIFSRDDYRYYLSVNQILEGRTFGNSFILGLDLFKYKATDHSWETVEARTATMTFKTPPDNYKSDAKYLEGDLLDEGGKCLGRLTMGWVSKYLRKATVEIDRVCEAPGPVDNGSEFGWRDVFSPVKWDMNAYESDTDIQEPSGESWSTAELHKKMLTRKDRQDLDNRWRYHLLAVKKIDITSRGIMFDAYATDSNNVPREGAAIASNWKFPVNQFPWGNVEGNLFGDTTTAYFRTAVHEIGHAMGLYHNSSDNGFMRTTPAIAANSPSTFPENIQWSFNGRDEKWLKHAPDPWVRPGMVPFEHSRNWQVLSPDDEALEIEGLKMTVTPLTKTVPIGAPVRVTVEVENTSDTDIPFPKSMSLSSGAISGSVSDPSNMDRTYRGLVVGLDEEELGEIKAHTIQTHDMTLLRGGQGALFQTAGVHNIRVELAWEIDELPVKISSDTRLMITPALNKEHAEAALTVLDCPDLLLTLALGGDHIEDGLTALKVALDNKILAPHFQVIEAKRVGRPIGKQKADVLTAARLITKETIISGSEAVHIKDIILTADKKLEKDPAIVAAQTIIAERLPTLLKYKVAAE